MSSKTMNQFHREVVRFGCFWITPTSTLARAAAPFVDAIIRYAQTLHDGVKRAEVDSGLRALRFN